MAVDLTDKREPRMKTSVSLPPDLQQAAHGVAIQYGMSLSEYVVRLLRADLAERNQGKKD
jgi:hypothetical protein